MTSGHSSHVFPSPPAWHLSIISLVGMPGSCHHHHGNVSVLPVAITMAMGVSPSNHQHGPNVSLLTRITMAICACRNTESWYVCGYVCVCVCWKEGKNDNSDMSCIIGHWWWIFSLSLYLSLSYTPLSLSFSSTVFHISLHQRSGSVPWCRPCPKWGPAGGLNGTDGAAVHPIPLLNTVAPSGSSPAPSAWDII